MARHARATLRASVQAALLAAGTMAGTRVYRSRIVPVATSEMPSILVYVSEETETLAQLRGTVDRTASLVVEGYEVRRDVAGGADIELDEKLDALGLAIENAMNVWIDESMRGLVQPRITLGRLVRTVLGLSGGDAEAEFGAIRLTYLIDYRTRLTDPTAST